MGEWRTGNEIGVIYEMIKEDLPRVGHSWMEGRLRIGDLALCIEHSGDCFYDYILIDKISNGMTGIPESEFGAYVMHKQSDLVITGREYHLLAAGEFVQHNEWLEKIEK